MQQNDEDRPRQTVTRTELFFGFLKIGLIGFGGVAPWARHVIVEERGWLSDRDYAAILGIGQILPGPNTMNASIIIGHRFQGSAGAIICPLAQMAAPLVIVTALATLYARFASVPEVNAAVSGAAAAAAGLVMGTALKMVRNIKPARLALVATILAFAAVGLAGWPLIPVVVVLAPLSVAAAALERRR